MKILEEKMRALKSKNSTVDCLGNSIYVAFNFQLLHTLCVDAVFAALATSLAKAGDAKDSPTVSNLT